MKGDFHLAGAITGYRGDGWMASPCAVTGSGLHLCCIPSLKPVHQPWCLLSSDPTHTTDSRGMAQTQPLATGEAGSPAPQRISSCGLCLTPPYRRLPCYITGNTGT